MKSRFAQMVEARVRIIPLLAEEGWTRHEENVPLPIWRGRGGQFGEIFRPKDFAELTTPSAALQWLRDFLLMPQPPLLCEEGNLLSDAGFVRFQTPRPGFVKYVDAFVRRGGRDITTRGINPL